jgi:hypothetical protein
MEPISTMSHDDLVRGREAVVRKLEEREPVLMLELRLYDAALAQIGPKPEPPAEKPYAGIRQPKNVIPVCLKRNNRWMTRYDIMSDLANGGYAIDNPAKFPNQISDALRYHTRRGSLIRRDEAGNLIEESGLKRHFRFKNEEYGLPAWNEKPLA